ncbi:MAG: hypothetical protein RLZZ308_525 [Candidatus Parcubacteria bacterium]|jgi:hypothetical protein
MVKKLDPKYLAMMAGIMGDIVFPKAGNKKLAKELMFDNDDVRMLTQLRIDFIVEYLIGTKLQLADRQERFAIALKKLNTLRDTPGAQAYLQKYPMFFTEVDRAIFRRYRANPLSISI